MMANSSSNAEKGKSGVNAKGEYVRKGGMFRDWITGKAQFPIHDGLHLVVCSGLTKRAWVEVF